MYDHLHKNKMHANVSFLSTLNLSYFLSSDVVWEGLTL